MVKKNCNIIYIILLLLTASNSLKAQDITINLSIRWDNHIDANGNKIQTPFLDITYINNTIDKKYYLLKQSRQNKIGNPFPEFADKYKDIEMLNFRTFEETMDYNYRTWREYTDTSFIGQYYYILIGNNDLDYGTKWNALKDTILYEYNLPYTDILYNDFKYDLIESALVSAYDSIYISIYGHADINRIEFLKTEFTDSTISNSAIENFVLLNPKEKHVDTYNLHGLQLVGGNFEILFKKNIITDKVYNGHYWDIKSQKMVESYIKLPQKVNGYQLYSGKFKTNHAFLEIKE